MLPNNLPTTIQLTNCQTNQPTSQVVEAHHEELEGLALLSTGVEGVLADLSCDSWRLDGKQVAMVVVGEMLVFGGAASDGGSCVLCPDAAISNAAKDVPPPRFPYTSRATQAAALPAAHCPQAVQAGGTNRRQPPPMPPRTLSPSLCWYCHACAFLPSNVTSPAKSQPLRSGSTW